MPGPFVPNTAGYTGEPVPPSISDARPVADELQYAKDLEDAGFSKGMVSKLSRDGLMKAIQGPDLMDEFQASQDGPVKAGEPYTDNGEVVGRTTDNGEGSTGFEPVEAKLAQMSTRGPSDPMNQEVPPFTFEGENLNGEPPAFGRGPEPYVPRVVTPIADALPGQGGLDPAALTRLQKASGDTFKRMQEAGAFDGDRYNRFTPLANR
jgi:hypothetical protein